MEKIVFFLLAGCSEGVMDYLQFHYSGSNKFWNPSLSWVNKWHEGNPLKGERFFLSSSVLVFLTDGWHLMKWIRNRFIDLTLFTLLLEHGFLTALIWVISLRIIYGLGFNLSYR